MPQFGFGERLRAGFGLGVRYTVSAVASFGEVQLDGNHKKVKIPDRSISPVVAFVPVELQLVFSRFSYSLRAEPSLTRVSRLDARSGERNLVVFVEVGYRF